MNPDIIQVKYDDLENLAARFGQQSENNAALGQRVRQAMAHLDKTGWEGKGAEAFQAEMTGEVLPAFDRLTQALQQSQSVTRQMIAVMRQAEEEAARVFRGVGRPLDSDDKSSTRDKKSETKKIKPYKDGPVPLYILDMDDPNFDAEAFVANIQTDGRPVIFMAHGINTPDEGARDKYSTAAEWYSKTYGHLPENKRPIIIGIDWDSGDTNFKKLGLMGAIGVIGTGTIMGGGLMAAKSVKDDYKKSNENAVKTGQRLAKLIEQFNRFHPESHVNVVAHSLGNRMFMEAVRSGDLRINSYLAIQGAVDHKEISSEGRFKDVLNTNEIARMGATYTGSDPALRIHNLIGYDEALGTNARKVKGREIKTYDMGPNIEHYGYDNNTVNEKVTKGFFGTNGEGF